MIRFILRLRAPRLRRLRNELRIARQAFNQRDVTFHEEEIEKLLIKTEEGE